MTKALRNREGFCFVVASKTEFNDDIAFLVKV